MLEPIRRFRSFLNSYHAGFLTFMQMGDLPLVKKIISFLTQCHFSICLCNGNIMNGFCGLTQELMQQYIFSESGKQLMNNQTLGIAHTFLPTSAATIRWASGTTRVVVHNHGRYPVVSDISIKSRHVVAIAGPGVSAYLNPASGPRIHVSH